jgi:hypothetical protein
MIPCEHSVHDGRDCGRYRHDCAAYDVRTSELDRADLIVASGQRNGAVRGVDVLIGLEGTGEIEAVGSEIAGLGVGGGCQSAASEP